MTIHEIDIVLTIRESTFCAFIKGITPEGYANNFVDKDDLLPIRFRSQGKLSRLDYIKLCEVMLGNISNLEQLTSFRAKVKNTKESEALTNEGTFTFDSVPLLYTGNGFKIRENTKLRITCLPPQEPVSRMDLIEPMPIDMFELFKALAYLAGKNAAICSPRSIKRANISFFQTEQSMAIIEKKGDKSTITFQRTPEEYVANRKKVRRKKSLGELDSGTIKAYRDY